jgi:murein DD-endopeptidase MepM/ murein hydrolase activator NlpD
MAPEARTPGPSDGRTPLGRWWPKVGVRLAARPWSVLGLVAALVIVGGGAYLAANSHGSGPATARVTGPTARTRNPGPARQGSGRTVETAPTTAPLAMPVAGTVEAPFGWVYSSYLGEWYYNPGVTLAAKQGTPVHAAWGGTVTAVGQKPYMGLTVQVNNGHGYSTVYGHLATVAVKAGQMVDQGQVLGTVGGQSLYSRQTGAHLDFQVNHNQTTINPESLVKGSS